MRDARRHGTQNFYNLIPRDSCFIHRMRNILSKEVYSVKKNFNFISRRGSAPLPNMAELMRIISEIDERVLLTRDSTTDRIFRV